MKHRHQMLVTIATLLLSVAVAHAQKRTVTLPSSTEYDRGVLWRALFGETWRDLWRAEITVPVLDLGAYAGGLEPYQAGGNQTRTLRFRAGDGRIYMFRSTDKDVNRGALPDDLRNTPIGAVIQDQTSSMHPSGAVAVAVLQDAVELLHSTPTLVYLPDDPRLGEFRAEYANLLGQIEERPEDPDEGKPFADYEKLTGTAGLLEDLEESMEDRFASREYLTARLIDFIVGDTDRGGDQWRFGKFEAGDRDVFRPIPRDRDYAFIESNGVLIRIGAMIYPKLTNYTRAFPKLRTLTYMTRDFDRSHLVDVPPAAWDSAVTFVQQRLTDDVIARAVAQLPPPHRELSGGEIERGLRARRDQLHVIARDYYELVNEDADIFASDENERAEIDRLPDGSVTVRIWREGAGGEFATDGRHEPAFERTFVPAVTDEIRVFLERGDDRAIVRGNVERSIELRIVGGEGNDVLVDSSNVAHGDKTHFYDAHGNNTIIAGANTRVIRTPFVTAPPQCSLDDDEECEEKRPRVLREERRGRPSDLQPDPPSYLDKKTRSDKTRTWGKVNGWGPHIGYKESNGVVLGLGPTSTDYGFRRRPYESRVSVRAMVGTLSGNLGVQLTADRYFEVAPLSVSLFMHATQLEAQRFFGYGNDTPLIDPSLSLVERDEIMIAPTLRFLFGQSSSFSVGPIARYVRQHPVIDSPAEPIVGTEGFGQAGGRAHLLLDYVTRTPVQLRGFTFQLGGSAYPAVWDAAASFGDANALARLYVPLGSATFALRAGGQRVFGAFPAHEAALIGGNATLRGYAFNRFAGDAAAYGAAELRLPVARVTLLTRGDLGVIGFSDAGRVWIDDVSDGGWHTSYGGGLFFGSLGHTLSVTYAKGEEGRFYFSFGPPF
ncbi:MAG: BamA/TamA family outer membrane protein [Gemmatimonadota bacterium]